MNHLVALFAIAVSGSLPSAQQPSRPELTLRISAPVITVKSGSDVYIKIQMTNTSDHAVDCSTYNVSGTDRRFRVEVQDASGKSMKKKDLHPEMVPGSFASCILQPGETVSRDDRISWANDLTRPGVYAVQVARVVGKDEEDGLVKSNKITITVTP